ncbi:hypothetical protein Bbelb_036470 [Branchiostoma belcheri]|nr:hypothetical protein Bbelb_036470 [Branchiostoma belcheri]
MRHSPELIRSLMHVVRLAVNHFRSQGNRHHGDMRPNPSTHRGRSSLELLQPLRRIGGTVFMLQESDGTKQLATSAVLTQDHICLKCGRLCASGFGLRSHMRSHPRD